MTTELSAERVASAVFEVEAALDLTESAWLVAGLHLWPLYRMALYHQIFRSRSHGASATDWKRILGTTLLQNTLTVHWPERGAFWLVSDGLSYVSTAKGYVDKFCAPLKSKLRDLGKEALIVDRASFDRHGGAASADLWCAPGCLRSKAYGSAISVLGNAAQHSYLCGRVNAAAGKIGVQNTVLSPRSMSARTAALLSIRRWFRKQLHYYRATGVFVVNYYDVSGFAVTAAANDLGITSVDIQHGVSGALHPGYAKWTKVPPDGYSLLPRWFWCWRPDDAKCIEDWAKDLGPIHRAVVGGHLYVDAWRSGWIERYGDNTTQVEKLNILTGSHRMVLVTLQLYLTGEDVLQPLLAAMSLTPEVMWMLRVHPMDGSSAKRLKAMLAARDVKNFEIDFASEVPLPLLLERADWHVTHSSSTVLEAAVFGLRSIVWSQYGKELFAEQSSTVIFSSEPGEIARTVVAESGRSTAAHPSVEPAMKALDMIMSARQ